MYRVPLVFWPFQADQPYNALRTTKLGVGFELVEVRTGGSGTRIPYRCKELPAFTTRSAKAEIQELVDKLRGDEGSQIRENFESLADKMGRAWSLKDGTSLKDFDLLLDKFVSQQGRERPNSTIADHIRMIDIARIRY